MSLQVFQILIVSQLYLMAEIDNSTQILQIVELVVNSILYATVQIDGQYRLRTCRYTTCTQCIAKTIVGNLVAQTAARAQ